MPRFKDLLLYLTKPGLEDIWVMLDIKPDNDAEAIMRLIAATIAEVKPTKPWNERIVLGVWAVRMIHLPLCLSLYMFFNKENPYC
jgi:phosphatidylglycerol phospholipase C